MHPRHGQRKLLTVLAAGILLLPASVQAQQQQQQPEETPHMRLLKRAAESRVRGAQNAPDMVYEISDFQCPYCRSFAVEVFPQIDSAYVRSGKVQWVFVSLPMPSHLNAWIAAEAALCAGAVSDRFWTMHDRIFRSHAEWTTAADPGLVMTRFAREAGVSMEAYRACVDQDRVAPLLLQDVIFGSRVSGTPTYILNNQQTVVGVKSFAEWREILEAALKGR